MLDSRSPRESQAVIQEQSHRYPAEAEEKHVVRPEPSVAARR